MAEARDELAGREKANRNGQRKHDFLIDGHDDHTFFGKGAPGRLAVSRGLFGQPSSWARRPTDEYR